MEKLTTFEEFLNENINEGIKTGDEVTHRVFADIKGKVIAGPSKFADLEKTGIDMPEEDGVFITSKNMNKPVWIGIELNDGKTKFGANMEEFK